ncbi:MAG: DUF4290 domain-containing protein [Paludibacteraceae bacterium]|nr:DUF4290 domain-containing protein [Paludibacteraceae bacterium]
MKKLNRFTTPVRMRNYGRIIQEMVRVATEETDITTREKMTVYIARSMRLKNLIWNKDQETGLNRVKEDISALSDGRLTCDFPSFETEMAKNQPQNQQQNKKNRK